MLTWEEITAVEPRLVELERTAVLAALSGTSPDWAYTDAKPFIGALVGWRRGRPPLVKKPSPLQHRYGQAVTGVVSGDADDSRLRSQTAYEVVCGRIHDAVVNAALLRSA